MAAHTKNMIQDPLLKERCVILAGCAHFDSCEQNDKSETAAGKRPLAVKKKYLHN